MLIVEKLRFINRWICPRAPMPPADGHVIPCAQCQEMDKAAFEIEVKCAILLLVGYLAMAVIVSVFVLGR